MLIKEYRIPLPLSTTEFEIADLYTIQVDTRIRILVIIILVDF